ncbi:MAG: DUF1318 domain-containing protein [Verrucomicrobia bacterium]|nr:DUF1318 domain-containing protein [Verrucomicrobiota bacterium]
MKTTFPRLLAVVLALGFAAAPVMRAEDLGTVKARMAQRISSIDQLKTKGELGENNRGLLEQRGGGGEAASVAAAENRDREEVYAAIAKQTGTSADQVAKARARQIAAASASGVWLQREDGGWYKK